MATGFDIPTYGDALVVLGTAGIVVPLARRFGWSPVVAYLIAGAVVGPYGLGSLAALYPWMAYISISDGKNVGNIAEFGVIFLLFLIGLELSYERLISMRRLVFGLGSLQIIVSALTLSGVLLLLGLSPSVAVVIGSCLSLSSTAIIIELLSQQGRMATATGRASFAILLAQDLSIVPLLIFITILGSRSGGSVTITVLLALAQAVLAIAVIVIVGRLLLRPLFRLVAGAASSDLFIAAILFVIVATGVIAALANLSMALGAFIAGLLLAETEYRRAIETLIKPFKGLLLGIFFFTVGMGIDGRVVVHAPVMTALGIAALFAIKGVIAFGAARSFRLSRVVALEVALLLAAGGEFAFVGLGLALSLDVVPAETGHFALAVTSLTMLLLPAIATLARRLSQRVDAPRPVDPALSQMPGERRHHAIVVGYGRVGKVVGDMLRRHGLEVTAIDSDARSVSDDRRRGHEVYFGDASDPQFLENCGIADASAVVITIHSMALIARIVEGLRRLRPDLVIISRARDGDHARQLYALGVTDAVPETIEASLQLSEAALVGLGKPMGPVIASIHERRDEFRKALQEAAKTAGQASSHAVKRKA
ncbi:cation:proton antiporter [Candidatus Raskinella chloraquaticus]|uniref:Potassium transporter TrkA n=1 Tax=Candidatus Raskinella chloraquaticus TaxID=1951219 RepID=A0A1W9I0I3_9HYPH|nr:MAG: potassium transporter TrkA [Proteobacteria bacterium SG_bin8]